jgi:hypothetical protein
MGPVLGVMGGALHLGPAVVAIIPVWLGFTYATARYVYRRMTRKRAAELEALADRVAALVAELVASPQRLRP